VHRRDAVWLMTFEPMPNPTVGGPFVRLGALTEALSKTAEVHLFSRGEVPRARQLERLWGARHTRLPGLGAAPGRRLTGMVLLATPYLLWRAARERPDVVIAANCVYAPLLALLRHLPLRRRPSLWCDMSAIVSLEIEQSGDSPQLIRRRQRVWRYLENLACRHADLVTTVNGRMGELVRGRTGRSSEIRVLRNAGSVAPPLRPDPEFLRSIGIEESDTVCFYAGTLFSGRLLPLLNSFPRALEQEPSLKLLIAGVGPDLELYRRLGRERVVFAGFRSGAELAQMLARADIAFSDCWADDGFPLKAFLYMGAGKAILIEDKPQIHEVLADGREAVFVRDEASLAERLVALARDPAWRIQLGGAARDLLEKAHSWEVRSEEVQTILGQLLGRREGARAPASPTRPSQTAS
jgi:glycosyltransferase involved in cell wall biosynthesis